MAASMPRSIASPRNIERVDELGRLDEDVEREVDAPTALVRDAAGLAELVERELRAFVARVEPRGAEVDGVGAVGDGGANGVERAGGSEQLGDGSRGHRPERINLRRGARSGPAIYASGLFLKNRSAVAAAKNPIPIHVSRRSSLRAP